MKRISCLLKVFREDLSEMKTIDRIGDCQGKESRPPACILLWKVVVKFFSSRTQCPFWRSAELPKAPYLSLLKENLFRTVCLVFGFFEGTGKHNATTVLRKGKKREGAILRSLDLKNHSLNEFSIHYAARAISPAKIPPVM